MKVKTTNILFPLGIVAIAIAFFAFNQDEPNEVSTADMKQPVVDTPAPTLTSEITPTQKSLPRETEQTNTNGGLIEKPLPNTELAGYLADHLDKLFELYHAGDLEAGYVLAMNLKRCNGAVTTVDTLNSEVNGLYTMKDKGITTQKNIDRRKHEIEESYYFCKDVPKEISAQYFDVLETTAQRGSIPAQTIYSITVNPIDVDTYPHELTHEQRIKLIEVNRRFNHYMENAANSGSMMALNSMVINHLAHNQNDLVKALTYNLALIDLTKNDGLYAMHLKFKEQLISQMTSEQADLAQKQSKAVIARILKSRVIYTY